MLGYNFGLSIGETDYFPEVCLDRNDILYDNNVQTRFNKDDWAETKVYLAE